MAHFSIRLAVFGCALIAVSFAAPIAAAPPAAEFPVTTAQMQALGVTLATLEKPAPIGGMAYPARVVVPQSGNQVISAPLAGRVEEVLVDEQQVVEDGQPLLRLISPEFIELQVKLLEAASKARLTAQTAARERQLFKEGIIPERRVQEASAAHQESLGRLRLAEASLRLIGVDPAALVKKGNAESLQDRLVVRARSSGTVVGLDVRAGQRVQSSDALIRLVSVQQLWLEVIIPTDRQQRALSDSDDNVFTVVGREASAKPMSIGAMVSESQTVTLRARVVTGAEALRPGEVVQVRVPFAANAAGWALPLQAIARQEDKAYVFVRTAKGFVAEPVEVVSSAGQSVQVSGNLRAGQQVASSSVITLKAAWLGKSGSN